MTNLSILQRNIIDSLSNEEAQIAFLKAEELAANDRFSYFAERIARETEQLCDFLKPSISKASEPFSRDADVQSELLDFILKRHWHLRAKVA